MLFSTVLPVKKRPGELLKENQANYPSSKFLAFTVKKVKQSFGFTMETTKNHVIPILVIRCGCANQYYTFSKKKSETKFFGMLPSPYGVFKHHCVVRSGYNAVACSYLSNL